MERYTLEETKEKSLPPTKTSMESYQSRRQEKSLKPDEAYSKVKER